MLGWGYEDLLYFLLSLLKLQQITLKKKNYLCALFLKSISGTCLKSVIFRRWLLSTDPGLLIATFPSLQPTLGPHNPNRLWPIYPATVGPEFSGFCTQTDFLGSSQLWSHLWSQGKILSTARNWRQVFPPVPCTCAPKQLLHRLGCLAG